MSRLPTTITSFYIEHLGTLVSLGGSWNYPSGDNKEMTVHRSDRPSDWSLGRKVKQVTLTPACIVKKLHNCKWNFCKADHIVDASGGSNLGRIGKQKANQTGQSSRT